MINFTAMNLSERWATRRGRIQIILVTLILATIPCYCAGLIILMIDPQPGGLQTPTVVSLTGTTTATPSTTPPTLVYFQSPTVTSTGTITQTPTASKTYALPATFTATISPIPSSTPTPEPSLTDIPTQTETPFPITTDTPSPTP
jgi:hypothetical protein